MGTLDSLSSEQSSGVVRQCLTTVREHLGMDIAFVAEFSEGHLEFRSLEGDGGSFGFEEGGNISLEARDGYTGEHSREHSREVVKLSAEVARRLGLSEEEVEDVETAALLHDVGKMGISDAILRKPGPLSDEEWEAMRRHPEIGEQIVASIESLSHLAPIIRAEHERWDGGGYPDGLTEEEIPLASRIVLASDAFHAMISDRPYRKAMSPEAALRELEKNADKQFELRVVGTLVEATKQVRTPG